MLVNRQRLIRELIAIVIAIPLSVVLRSLQFAPQLSWLELFVLSAFACVTIGQLFFNLRQALQLQEVATIRGWLLYWYPISTVGLIFLLVMLYAHLPSNTSVWGILLLFAMYLGHLTNLERVTAKIIEMQSPIDNASSGGKVTPEQSDPKFQLRLMGALAGIGAVGITGCLIGSRLLIHTAAIAGLLVISLNIITSLIGLDALRVRMRGLVKLMRLRSKPYAN